MTKPITETQRTKILELRHKRTGREIAKLTGVSVAVVSRVLSGKHKANKGAAPVAVARQKRPAILTRPAAATATPTAPATTVAAVGNVDRLAELRELVFSAETTTELDTIAVEMLRASHPDVAARMDAGESLVDACADAAGVTATVVNALRQPADLAELAVRAAAEPGSYSRADGESLDEHEARGRVTGAAEHARACSLLEAALAIVKRASPSQFGGKRGEP